LTVLNIEELASLLGGPPPITRTVGQP
jgi:hypothetical protein